LSPEDHIVNPENEVEDDIELWIRSLFRPELWLGDDLFGSKTEMLLLTNESQVFLTGILCKSFVTWNIHTHSPRKHPLKSGVFVCQKVGIFCS
jgi:hypothetical protein